MSATLTMSKVEDRIRLNHLNDSEVSNYRWLPHLVLCFISDSIEELCQTMNPWAKYDQDTGDMLTAYNVTLAGSLTAASDATAITNARAEVIPVDNRFEQAIVHLAASKCFRIDDSDVLNQQKAAELYSLAERYAQS